MFRKIEKGHDWESIGYAFDGELLDASGTYDTKSWLLLEPAFTAQVRVRVRWPDGRESEEFLAMRPVGGSYSDHGHHVSYVTHEFGVMAQTSGASVFVPLEQLMLDDTSVKRRRDR